MKKVLSQADSGKDSHHRMKLKSAKKHRRNQNLKRIWISLLILASYGAWQSNLSISSACAIQSQLVVIQFFKVVPERSLAVDNSVGDDLQTAPFREFADPADHLLDRIL